MSLILGIEIIESSLLKYFSNLTNRYGVFETLKKELTSGNVLCDDKYTEEKLVISLLNSLLNRSFESCFECLDAEGLMTFYDILSNHPNGYIEAILLGVDLSEGSITFSGSCSLSLCKYFERLNLQNCLRCWTDVPTYVFF